MTGDGSEFDVVVVGAGSAGAALAARLSEDPGRSVLLVERGVAPTGVAPLDPDRLPAVGDDRIDRVEMATGPGRTATLLTGSVLGGSGAVNGAYFVRPTDADLDRWAALGNDRWSAASVLPSLRRLESDAELGGTELHGTEGPMSVTRHSAPPQRVTEALFDAASNLGHPPQHDLNGGGAPGYGLVPRNIDRRGRVSTARSYLEPALGRVNLRLRLGVEAQRVVIHDGRAVGVEVRAVDGSTEVVRAAEVVLSAGAVRSAALLWRSGIGPADALRAAGVHVVVDAAGLGAHASNHPAIDLFYEPMPGMVGPEAPLLQGALHLDTPSGAVVEVLAMCRPYGVATGADPIDGRLSMRVSPMSVERPTRVVPGPGGLSVDAGYLEDPRDRTAAREAVRAALELVRAAPMRDLIDRWHGPDDATVAQDPLLDAWIAEHVGTSHHLCSTAPMGPDADTTAVVDQWGRVRGVDGLRVVDLSILPTAPSRGPACSAVLVAEHLAETFD